MKKIVRLSFLLFLIAGVLQAQANLFFSEYIEGGSSRKALEIYNASETAVDLTDYVIMQSTNGSGWQYYHNFPAEASIEPGDVWVIITNDDFTGYFDTALADEILAYPSVVHHNGDDARAIGYIGAGDTTIIDVIGIPDEDPGSGWDVAGVTTATANHTLVRKETVTTGNIDWLVSAGTTTEDSEWIVYDQDIFDYLGAHPGMPTPALPNVFFSEYIEGSSNNKALEIYNAGPSAVDLTTLNILTNYNGNPWSGMHSFPEGATLEPDSVWVMANSGASASILTQADEIMAYDSSGFLMGYNGDDVRALVQIDGVDTTIIDIIGRYDFVDPGNGWSVGDTLEGTKDHTLVRKESVTTGNSDWDASAGTTDDNSEWIIYGKDNFDYIGIHPGTTAPPTATVYTIAEIQETVDGGEGDSPHNGEYVQTTGVVTAASSSAYFLQDGTGAWNGIYVYSSGHSAVVGDSATLVATVSEYNGLTELVSVEEYTVHASGVAMPAPVEVPTDSANAEMYESVLLTVKGMCDAADLGFGEWSIVDDSGVPLRVDDVFYAYTPTEGNIYVITAPNFYSFGDYKLVPRDSTDIMEIENLSIYDIQFTETDSSAYFGQVVATSGVVTATSSSAFFLQDGMGAWNGIYVYSNGHSAVVGDSAMIVAEVDEYNGLTELTNVQDYSVMAADVVLPMPAPVGTNDLNDEMYESVLVTTVGVCTDDDLGFGEWAIDDGSGQVVVDDMFYTFTPTLGTNYSVTGPLTYSFGAFKIEPRDSTEISEVMYEADLFISEYIEGSGNNKALEIYNPKLAAVDFSTYRMVRWNNGGTSTSKDTLQFVGELAAGDVYVIANSSAVQEILDQADTTHSMTFYNGDDYIALEKYDGSVWNLIDVFGEATGVDPGTGWEVAGVTDATAEHTLVRKEDVMMGTTDWAESAGTDSASSQWLVYPQDVFIYLGVHPGPRELPDPEPSEFPTNFTAEGIGTSISLTWTDAAGDQLPGGYLILGSDEDSFTLPVDGTPVDNDNDFSDGSGAINVPYGVEQGGFSDLTPNSFYYFQIYSYTNDGTQIDYKTDGEVPAASDSTGEQPVVIGSENFETGLGSMTEYSVAGPHVWTAQLGGGGANGTDGYAEMNGYPYDDEPDNDYLISPEVDFSIFEGESISFWLQWTYGQDGELTLEYSEDYSGSGDPTVASWTAIPFTSPETSGAWTKISVDLSFLNGESTYLAFHYSEHPPEMSASRRWRVDEIEMTGVPTIELDFPPNVESMSRSPKLPTAEENTVVTAEVTDDNGITSVTLFYVADGVEMAAAMTNTSGDFYEGTIPATMYGDGSLVSYAVVATDNAAEPQSDTSGVVSFFAGNTEIAVAKALNEDGSPTYNNLYVRVTGTVTAGSGTYSTGRLEGYLQDSTAGVSIFNNYFSTPELVNGFNYTVIGRIANYNGLIEIMPDSSADITDNGEVGVPEPVVLTIPEFYSDPEMYEGMLVKIDNMTLSSTTPWDCQGSGSNLEFYVDGDTVVVRIDADTDICGAEEPSWPRDIVTIVGQYDNSSPYFEGYQLLPRSTEDFMIPDAVNDDAVPEKYALFQNYPNPFNPTTTIKFAIPEAGLVTLKVYNILGQEVATLINKELDASFHVFEFDATQLSSGVYLYSIQAGSFFETKKMLLLK
ncbi:MAG: lamin tail domain-containing protein [Melioribacteraceae bacterium]|nr:lamin tail domain-containing protein [Melioribacteraceae bacterium]MCF8353400.1 lamin tail domain-containing protein [Melioribacteraceae bacterium]MCF8393021.1 lamin tail domain-containing protein [Melioribacteraceae bacterium]MCF8419126.1 lamin tail domain-containing protein [Melioribacteraceae bacterium]